MLKIDTHAHAWDGSCTYLEGSRYHPSYTFTCKEYLERLDSGKLAYGVLVQPSFLGTDNTYLLDALKRYPNRLRGVVVVDETISHEELIIMDQMGVKGIRFNLVGREVSEFDTVAYKKLIKVIEALGWHLELHALPHQWKAAMRTFKAVTLPVVIDHFGRPEKGRVECGGLKELLDSGLDLHVKLSAPYRFEHEGVEPLVDFWEQAVGLEKLLWGSDTPHTTFEKTWTFKDSWNSLGYRSDDPVFVTHLNRNAERVFHITL